MINKWFLNLALLLIILSFPLSGRADFEFLFPENSSEQINLQQEITMVPDSLTEFYEYANTDTILRLAVVLSDIYSKKDMEFTRGLLMGMQQSSLPESSVSLKIVNGDIPEDSLQYELSLFGPHVIISTFDKDSPRSIRTYSQENETKVLNIFDARSDDYLYNNNIFQLLAPSDKFNSEVSRYIQDNFQGNILVLIGDPDPTDSAIRDLILSWPEEELMIISKEDLNVFELEDERNYLMYPLFTANDDVKSIKSQIVRLISDTPSAGVRIFGRPNWIAFTDLQTIVDNLEVYLPAKCYFDASAGSGKRFISAYNASFGHAPIRSYPVYAVMGFDTAEYFLPLLIDNLRGIQTSWEPRDLLQSFFSLRKSDWGGFYNNGGYILHYEPWGSMSRELIGAE